MERRTTIIVFSIASILAIGLISSPAYASFTQFEENFVHLEWQGFGPQSNTDPFAFTFDEDSAFDLYTTGFTSGLDCNEAFLCTFRLVDFVDDLEAKLIEVDITYETGKGVGPNKSEAPTITEITCFDNAGEGGAEESDGLEVINVVDPDDEDAFLFDIICRPNPDWERIIIQLNENVTSVEFWTESFDDPEVGGTFIPLDTTALLLAGAQSISMWMIPVVVAGIGIGVFVIKRRD